MNIKTFATRTLGRSGLLLKKYSPEILMGVGIVGGVTAAVMGARATLKAESVVANTQLDILNVKETWTDEKKGQNPKGYTQDLTRAYTMGAINLTKLYWPAISLGAASIACVVGSHGIMRKRNAAVVVAYNALEKTFNEYRGRVAEKLGEDEETQLHLGIEEEEVIDEETGKKKVVSTMTADGVSQYARFFDPLSQYWSKTPEYNLTFVRAQQNYANDLLNSRGHVFLNEIYDSLGIDRTQAGAVVGWVLNSDGDSFIDFGIYDLENEKAREFVNGVERSILLDFNVDGIIYDKI